MKKLLSSLMVVVALVLFSNMVSATASSPNIMIEHNPFVTPQGEPLPYINKDKRTMGSVRLVSYALGLEDSNISWDKKTETVTLKKDDRTVQIKVGKKELTVNGKTVVMDTKAELNRGRVFIPIRFIGEALGLYVGFDSLSQSVLLSKNPISENANNNNLYEALGLTVVNPLPVTTTTNGLTLTLHEMFVYNYDSAEAKALNDKYQFNSWDSISYLRKTELPNLKAYVVKSKVTIKNDSKKDIVFDPQQRYEFYTFTTHKGAEQRPAYSLLDKYNSDYNVTEILNYIKVKPNESLTGYYYHIIHDYRTIDYIKLTVNNIYDYGKPILIAERK